MIPLHESMTYLCYEHTMGSIGRAPADIALTIYHSPLTPAELVKFYRQKLGDQGFEQDGIGGVWRLPTDTERPDHVIYIYAAAGISRCSEKAPKTGSLIELSRLTIRNPDRP